MWISVPVPDEEMNWIQSVSEPWKLSKDQLYRRSQVELALVPESSWKRWNLPTPSAPILTFDALNESALTELLQKGAQLDQAPRARDWGMDVGFVRFPSGLLIEVPQSMGGDKNVRG